MVDQSNGLRQNDLNFEASFTPNDKIWNNFPQAWNKLLDTVKILRSKLLLKKHTKELKIGEYKSEMNCTPVCYTYMPQPTMIPSKRKTYPCLDP